jgi:hypothetical protein
LSLREVSKELAARGLLNERGCPDLLITDASGRVFSAKQDGGTVVLVGAVNKAVSVLVYAIANTPVTEMRSPDPARWYVPVTRDAERALPNAWRKVAWRSEG